MIRLSEPSMVLHSFDVPGYKYKMWQTIHMPKLTVVTDVVNWILWGINNSPEMYLDNVVINCHGAPGGLVIGEKELIFNPDKKSEWISSKNVGAFAPVKQRGSLGTIWIVACEVGSKSKKKKDKNGNEFWTSDGQFFCSEFAKAAGCYVVAADKVQRVNAGFYLRSCPDNCIDKFEGTAYRWDPQGNREIYSN